MNMALVLWAVLGLVIGNFLAQVLNGKKNWGLATERSFFQIVAVAIVVMVAR